MYCVNCGQELPDQATFCLKCGAKVLGAESIIASNRTNNIIIISSAAVVLIGLALTVYYFGTAPSQPAATAPTPTSAKAESPTPALPLPTSFRRTFVGKIGDKIGVEMTLARDGGKLSGSYFYKLYGVDIPLKGTIDEQGRFRLEEASGGNKTGVFEGVLSGAGGPYKLEGNWASATGDKAMRFSAVEGQPSSQPKNLPYVGSWSNGRGEQLNITLKTLRFNGDEPVAYREITRVTDGKNFAFELVNKESVNYFQRYLTVTVEGSEMRTRQFDSFEDLRQGTNAAGEAVWFKEP